MSFPHPDAAVAYALSRGAQIVVLDPPEIRERVIAAAESLLAGYATTVAS
jgi:predicted DNA-binding transcriptional regulator YafY